MSPTKQWLIIVFGGTTIMVITMVCGVAAGFSIFRYIDGPFSSIIDLFLYVFSGGAIGAVVQRIAEAEHRWNAQKRRHSAANKDCC